MHDAVLTYVSDLLPVLVGGFVLGSVFYGSLWWTVRQGLPSSQPAWWFVCSMALRIGLGLLAIFLIGDGQWERLATCLLGFVLARPFVTRMTRLAAIRIEGPKR